MTELDLLEPGDGVGKHETLIDDRDEFEVRDDLLKQIDSFHLIVISESLREFDLDGAIDAQDGAVDRVGVVTVDPILFATLDLAVARDDLQQLDGTATHEAVGITELEEDQVEESGDGTRRKLLVVFVHLDDGDEKAF